MPPMSHSRSADGGGLPGAATVAARLDAVDWAAAEAAIIEEGRSCTAAVLEPSECAALAALHGDDTRFRSRIDMARHAYGRGDYGYFADPLPPVVAALRESLYRRLAPVANRMMAALRRDQRYPAELGEFRARCAAAGQTRPTPLLLHYEVDGFNCLHRDLYGDLAFPLQAVILLSRPGVDFTGGEFLLVENRPRRQASGEVVSLAQGNMLIFPVSERPVAGKRGPQRATMRHGVSRVRSGERYTLGVIFHDAA